jgi:integrase
MSRPRDHASAEGLLPRMEARKWTDGKTVTYRYRPLGAKRPINLGTDRQAALQAVLDMSGRGAGHGTLAWLWGQWTANSPRWKKLSDGSRADYETAWKQIDKVLGKELVRSITPSRVARYVHVDRVESPRRANIEKSVMSNLFKYGILLEVCNINATDGVEPHATEPSDVMPETMALTAFLRWLDKQSPQRRCIGFMAEYAGLTGNRRCEFLHLTKPQVDFEAGVVRTFRAKQRGKKRDKIVEAVKITPALKSLLDRIYATLEPDQLYLFPNRSGNPYTDGGWETMWNRLVNEAIEQKVFRPEQRFNFHALRRYFNTMHKAKYGEHANLHADPSITARIYDATTEERRNAL